jgi:hypothetical protein
VGQLPTQVPSALFAGTFWHEPSLPATLHDLQSGQLAEAQQVPSTQLPLAHSTPVAQSAPLVFFWQNPPMQP